MCFIVQAPTSTKYNIILYTILFIVYIVIYFWQAMTIAGPELHCSQHLIGFLSILFSVSSIASTTLWLLNHDKAIN